MPPLNALKDIAKPQPLEMEDDYLRENLSQQELVTNGGSRSDSNSTVEDVESRRPTRDQIKLVAILCFVNLINYMDRYTVAGLLTDIEVAFDLTEGQKGLLQTAFILVYMVMAPLYGYLGDRFNRRVLMAVGVFLWSLTALLGSFMQTYHWFLVMRCFVGIGEASYSTIAPTLISDIFVSNLRSKMLALFYFAIPVGSGLGYITGSEVADIAERFLPPAESADAWRWGLRVTPVMGLVAVLLIIFVLKEPPRGVSEGAQHLKPTSFISDIKHLVSNRTYIFTTLGFTCVTYVAGALAWWGPNYVELGVAIQPNPNVQQGNVSFIFGVIAMIAGLVGVPLGSFTGQKFRGRFPSADPIVCGLGLILSIPMMVGALLLAGINTWAAFAIVLIGQIFLNLNWAVVSDIVLYIVLPTRRSSAEAFQILISHAFGDAGSPYIVGVVADALKPLLNGTQPSSSLLFGTLSSTESYSDVNSTISSIVSNQTSSKYVEFKSLQYSLIICVVVELVAAIFFFWAAVHIAKDKEKCDRTIAEQNETIKLEDIPSPNSSSQKEAKLSVKFIKEPKTQTKSLPNNLIKEIKNDSKIIDINCRNGFSGYVPAIVYDAVPITDKQIFIVHL